LVISVDQMRIGNSTFSKAGSRSRRMIPATKPRWTSAGDVIPDPSSGTNWLSKLGAPLISILRKIVITNVIWGLSICYYEFIQLRISHFSGAYSLIQSVFINVSSLGICEHIFGVTTSLQQRKPVLQLQSNSVITNNSGPDKFVRYNRGSL